MNGVTRAGTEHGVPARRGHGAYTRGANALQVGYADAPGVEAAGAAVEAPIRGPRRSTPAREPRRPGRWREPQRPGHEPQPTPPRQREGDRRAPSAAVPAPSSPPLPIALPRPSFLVLILSIVVGGVLGVLVLNTKINENSFRLDRLQDRQAALDLQEAQLTQALADRESTGNLRAAAVRLGLVPAGEPAFITLPNGQVVGVPQPASGSTGASTVDGAGR